MLEPTRVAWLLPLQRVGADAMASDRARDSSDRRLVDVSALFRPRRLAFRGTYRDIKHNRPASTLQKA
jgi:hypothetical protein